MQTIAQYLPEHPFFAGLDAATTNLLAGCASNIHVRADELLFREGTPADHFYLLRHGRIAIEVRTPGPPMVLDTVEDGDVVGWSWVVPPYLWTFDGRASIDTSAVAFDAACLRVKCLANPLLGYDLMMRFVRLMNQRLQSARVRLIDMYGGTNG
ncbi:MAG TPA: Crp/Fnr family transcriptional regulator [Nakamurella sp.]